MHWSKNKKIISLIILGTIIHPVLNFTKVYASNVKNLASYMTIKNKQVVNEINNSFNVGSNLYVEGTIININDNYITIKDESGEAIIFIDTQITTEFKTGDFIFASGDVVINDEVNVLSINNPSNIGLVDSSQDDESGSDTDEDEDDKSDSDTDEDEDDKSDSDTNAGEDDKINNGNSNVNNNQNTNNNQNINNNPTQQIQGGNSSSIKPNTSISVQSNSNSQSTQQVSNTKTYTSRTPIAISSDLSETQWNKVKEALAEGSIKVKDIENNKIRITKVYDEYGDKTWIVNDPRMLDDENKTTTVGANIAKEIDYTKYDITNKKWDTYLEDINNGEAKLKVLDDNSLKIIYSKSNKSDYTIIIEKL